MSRSGFRWRRHLAAAAAVCLAVLGWVVYELVALPDVRALAAHDPATTAFIERYRSRAAMDPGLAPLRWTWVPDSAISVHVRRAVVVAEDIEFFSHRGFSTSDIGAALREALRELEIPRGASTITQQVAKNLWLSPSRSPLRKLKEVVLTRRLERHLTKRRILAIYLNVAEFGPGVYGVGAAARLYFDKPASDLTEHEAAMLAASLPRPSRWHPGVESASYDRYVAEIERRMAMADFLWKHVQSPGAPR